MKNSIIIISFLILLSGCYTTRLYTDTDYLRTEPDAETSHVSIVFSSIELDGPADLTPLCPSGISKLEMEQSFTDGLFHIFSFGLYSPQTARVWCKRRKRE